MNQLTNAGEVRKYLKENSLFLNQVQGIDFVDVGNINYVYRIRTEKRAYYLKFYPESPRRATAAMAKIGEMPDRFGKETGAIRFMKSMFDPDIARYFPDIVHLDKENGVAIMSDVSHSGDVLKELLLTDFDVDSVNNILEKRIAKMIAQQHARTFRKSDFMNYFQDDAGLNRRFYDFRTVVSCEKLSKAQQAEVKKRAERLYMQNRKFPCLINADLSPKQIFIWPDSKGIGLCDFEFMGEGLASYDVGFFIANMHIIRDVRDGYQKELDDAMKRFSESYFAQLKKEVSDEEFLRFTRENMPFFIGTGILNRLDAVPLEAHIPKSKVGELRRTAVDFIFNDRILE